ncbi:MAG: glycosyltransferase [Longimonas sp.]|uniref:glycosyltransferase n=1 Tax=Longimonas sp. TaxID=2039626 RepID=UPI00334D9CC5
MSPVLSPPYAPIVHIGPAYPYRGGIAHFTECTARSLKEMGYPPVLCTFQRQYPEWLFPGRTQTVTDTPPPPDLPIPHRRIDTLNPLSWHRTARWMQNGPFGGAVIQYWMPFMAPPFSWLAWRMRSAGRPVVAVVHNALPHERHVGDRWLSKGFLHQIDGAIALSDTVARDVHALAHDLPVLQVDHPTYTRFGPAPDRATARAQLNLPAEGPIVLFFGFVRQYKGLDLLLDAWPDVQAVHPDAWLCVAGEAYDAPAPYQAQIDALPQPDQVRWDDRYIPEREVARYFAAADLVVQPYRHATQSGVVRVAAHFDRPVVVTDVGNLPNAIDEGRTGFIVPPESPGQLGATVARALQPETLALLSGPDTNEGASGALAHALHELLRNARL